MRRPLLLAALVALAVALAGFAALLRGGENRPSGAVGRPLGPAGALAGPDSLPAAEVPPVAEAGHAPPDVARAADPAERREAAPPPATSGEGWRLVGRIAVPVGTPSDERAFVVALQRPLTTRALWSAEGPLPALLAQPDDLPPGVLARTAVGEEGRFELSLPAGTEEVHLAVAGRFLASEATTPARPGGAEPFLAPRLGALVRGRLLAPPDTAELEECEARLAPDLDAGFEAMGLAQTAVGREVRLDSEGRFEIPAVDTDRAHVLVVRGPSIPTVARFGLSPEPGETVTLDVELPRAAAVEGRVVDPDGAPVAEAPVVARRPGVRGAVLEELREATTDASGAFRLAALPPGPAAISCEVTGRGEARVVLQPELAPGETRRGIRLELREGEAIAGRVLLPDGTPAAGTRLSASPDPSAMGPGFDPTAGGTGIAREDGGFRIGGLSQGTFRVTAKLERESEADGSPESFGASVGGVRAGGEPLELRLVPLVELAGRVLGGDGEPLRAFSVEATLSGSGGMFGLFAEREVFAVEEAEDGTFRRGGFRPGTWDVVVRAPHHGPSAPLSVTLPLVAGAPLPEFRLAPAARIAGTVLDPAEAPVPGARVEVDQDLAARLGSLAEGGPPATYTDARGGFVLEDLAAGPLSLVASAPGFAPSAPVALELAPGEEREGVELRLRVGATLTGEVLDAEGHPAPGRRVIAQSLPGFRRQHMVATDAAGTFRLEHLAPGSWQVVAMADFLGDVDFEGDDPKARIAALLEDLEMATCELVDGEETHVVLGAPPEDPVTVRGRVTAGGEPVAGAGVTFQPEGVRGLSQVAMAVADADGAYETTLEGSGRYVVSVNAEAGSGGQNQIEFSREIPAGVDAFRLDLELPGGAIEGRVTDADGAPLEGCRVTVTTAGGLAAGTNLGGHWAEARTDADGRYRVRHLRAGTYRVAAGGPDLAGMFGGDARAGRVVRPDVRVEAGRATLDVDFVLEPPGTLAGVVLDANGAPVEGASVFLRDERGVAVERLSLLTTDAAGRFRYAGLAPGDYTACARSGEFASPESAPVTVRSGERSEVELRLAPGTRLLVRTLDEDGNPLPADLSVVDERGREHAGLVSLGELMQPLAEEHEPGTRIVGPLPPGRYVVRARAADGREADKPVRLSGRPTRRVNLRLR